ncbi:unnamed protein product [Arabidopsis halleri]
MIGRAGLLYGRMRLNQAQSDETSRLDSNNRSGQFGGALFDSVSKKKGQPSDISFDFTLGQSTMPKIKLSLKGYRFIYCVRVVPSPSSLAKAQSDRLNIGLIRRSLKLCCARDIRLELGQISSRTSRAVEGQHFSFVRSSVSSSPLVAYAPLFLCCLRCATEPFPGIYLLPVYSTALPSSLFCWYELIGPLKRKEFFSKDVDLWLGVVYSIVLSLCC